jgi:hypothetical protein
MSNDIYLAVTGNGLENVLMFGYAITSSNLEGNTIGFQ